MNYAMHSRVSALTTAEFRLLSSISSADGYWTYGTLFLPSSAEESYIRPGVSHSRLVPGTLCLQRMPPVSIARRQFSDLPHSAVSLLRTMLFSTPGGVAQLVPFFFTTWEHYYTHELILPIVNGPSEGVSDCVAWVCRPISEERPSPPSCSQPVGRSFANTRKATRTP